MLVIANHKSNDAAAQLPRMLKGTKHCDVVVCPPAFFVHSAVARGFTAGVQNIHFANSGAYTGENSPAHAFASGARWAIIGHSERRAGPFSESHALLKRKTVAALDNKLKPVFCIGESLKQREAGETLKVLEKQLKRGLPDRCNAENTVIAYEPIWAIGTGLTPTVAQIREVHDFIINFLSESAGWSGAQVLYGGSVNDKNAAEIFQIDSVAGGLVGGASLKASSFNVIINAAEVEGESRVKIAAAA